MGSVEPIKSIFQFTLISLHTDFEFPSNQCEAGTPCITTKISPVLDLMRIQPFTKFGDPWCTQNGFPAKTILNFSWA